MSEQDLNEHLERFPTIGSDSSELQAEQTNPAIRLYGRRFYKDQTPVEYLAEFLLVFASAKAQNHETNYQFQFALGECKDNKYCYFPEDRVALKLFSFFSSSKLETRHPVHRDAYLDSLEAIKARITGSEQQKEETVRLLQSLFGGFVGVAKNRTWVTYSFLPVSTHLLSREVSWEHPKAIKGAKGVVTNWDSSITYFADNLRNFMGRGGELLYLQIVNLFTPELSVFNWIEQEEYKYLKERLVDLQSRLEKSLHDLLEESANQLGGLASLVENAMSDYKINSELKSSNIGWVSKASDSEALLFAMEIDNICSSSLGALDKLDLLQTLCCMQVLRSLCFQARRIDSAEKTTQGFIGNYAWVVTDPDAKVGSPIRQMAQSSFERIDEMLYRVLRSPYLNKDGKVDSHALKNGDDNTFKHFRKFCKEIGLVIPLRGGGQRFTLHQGLLRFLVAALVAPDERIRLTHFYQRVFAHYGIALGGQQLAVALDWCGNESNDHSYAVSSNSAWVEEALQQGGFLVELSDAVSMVKNPG